MSAPGPTATDADLLTLLAEGELTVLGRLAGSSNQALLCQVRAGERQVYAVHKPVRLERPLWDYPDGTHAGREHAAYLIDRAGGFDLVPPTVMRDGPFGPGSVQLWVGDPEEEVDTLVVVCPPGQEPAGWLRVVDGEDERGARVVLAHSDDGRVRTMAVLDALLNNSDRKGGHVLREGEGVHAIDHGVSLGTEPKLRTVLWGWAGEPLPPADLDRARRVVTALDGALGEALAVHLTGAELDALRGRTDRLLETGRHPVPGRGWPAVPWPAM